MILQFPLGDPQFLNRKRKNPYKWHLLLKGNFLYKSTAHTCRQGIYFLSPRKIASVWGYVSLTLIMECELRFGGRAEWKSRLEGPVYFIFNPLFSNILFVLNDQCRYDIENMKLCGLVVELYWIYLPFLIQNMFKKVLNFLSPTSIIKILHTIFHNFSYITVFFI